MAVGAGALVFLGGSGGSSHTGLLGLHHSGLIDEHHQPDDWFMAESEDSERGIMAMPSIPPAQTPIVLPTVPPEQDALGTPKLNLTYPIPTHLFRRDRLGTGADYGERDLYGDGKRRFHGALDIGAPSGTPIYAAAGGVVQAARDMGSCGLGIVIRHRHPSIKYVTTTYCHLSQMNVSKGEKVARGQLIGLVGWTGNVLPRDERGAHLHFSVAAGSNWKDTVDPKEHFLEPWLGA